MEKIKVFIADDSPVARTMLKNVLSTCEEMEVVGEEATGEACVIMLEEAEPDIVLLEVEISGSMSIDNIVKEIKNINEKVKVVLCADPKKDHDKLISAVKFGADDFITKPYRKENLIRIIRTLCSK